MALQPHQAILPSFTLSTIIGEKSVPLWLPSQKGCFSDFPHAHQAYFFFSPVNTYGLFCGQIGLEHWYSPNAGATNESGFTGLPSGFRYWADGNYYYMGEYNYFWTSSEGFEPGFAPFRTLRYDNTWVYEYDYAKDHGFSIRCLKD